MNEITTAGLDLAKRVVSLCGENGSGRVIVQRTLRRDAVLAWFAYRLWRGRPLAQEAVPADRVATKPAE